ncbi:MAG TPA: stage II sporulation protein M [Candidatus Yaniella excrementavium]|nr:stage II sporulation protein M [Candidatus Yaniella excrementavium]
MDLEAYAKTHRPDWQRLETLAGHRQLQPGEVDELVELYGRVSTHLSMVQAQDPDGAYANSLSLTVARARARLTSATGSQIAGIKAFFAVKLPYALYQIRWLTIILGAAFMAIAVAYGFWYGNNPQMFDAMMPEQYQLAYVEEDFVDYYSENPAASFTTLVWVNNAWIALQEVAFGITGYFVPYVLFVNAQGLGISAALMHKYDELDTFFAFILPHGLMELSAIFIAGAAGLRVFWAWVAPGRRTRLQSLAYWGRQLILVGAGLVGVLLISGLVEGLVTPSPLPTWLKITIGALVLAGYWVYTWVLGTRAAKANVDADLDEYDGGRPTITG